MAKRNGKPANLNLNDKQPPISPQIARIRTLESIGSVPSTPSLNVNRLAYNVSEFNKDFVPIPTSREEKIQKFKPDVSRKAWIRRLRGIFPITLWLPEYNYRENLLTDILVGITVAIFQVPQSMGYCLIAHVPPTYGLYSAFFPALFYTIFGTGYHCAFGPFALVSGVMTGDIVTQVMTELGKDVTAGNVEKGTKLSSVVSDTIGTTLASADQWHDLVNIDIAIMVAMIIGIYILGFGILQLGFISNFMSEELISGFTTSASIIVFVSQLAYLLGVDYKHFAGPFNLYYTLEEVFTRLNEVNLTTLVITCVCLSILLFFKLVVNPYTQKTRVKTPFPIELCVVIGGTIVSHFMGLKDAPYHVKIVNHIADHFPTPMLPRWDLFSIMWSKCIATAIVGYTITLSVCKMYGKKHGYKTDANQEMTDANQEMVAMGAANMISSTFQCIPCAASLPRSALQETAGGKTQVVSIVNCLCIIVVILALGKYLEELPTCVLGSCIAVALVSLVTKVGDFWRFWKVSKLDGGIWIVTFLAVLVISVDYGLYIGLILSLLLLIWKSERPKTYLLGTTNDLDIYVPINKFNNVEEPKDFKIFQMCGPLNFSNVEYFSTELENK
ncbi:unnamed protein product, partial [Medioppia subpectinata]